MNAKKSVGGAVIRTAMIWGLVFGAVPPGGAQEKTKAQEAAKKTDTVAQVSAAQALKAEPGGKRTIASRSLSDQPLSFEENCGQSDASVRFLARGKGRALFLTKDEAVLALRKKKLSVKNPEKADEAVMRMKFSGAVPNAAITGQEPLPGKIYYADAKGKGPLIGNATFGSVKYSGIYPGIDVVYYGNERQLEFDFVIAPHADAGQIRLMFGGAEKISLTETGEVSLHLEGEEVRLKKPVIYQEHDGRRVELSGGYRLLPGGAQEVGFELAHYDESLPLIIDPTISFATYLGTSDDEFVTQLRVNAIGEAYVIANTDSPAKLPAHTTYPIETPQAGFRECFLTKLSNDGSTALYTVVFEGVQCEAMDLGPGKVHLAMGKSGNYLRTLTEDLQGMPSSLDLLQGAYDFSLGPVQWLRADANGNVYLIAFYTPTAPPDFVFELQKVDGNGQLVGKIQLIPQVSQLLGIGNQITGLDVDDSGNAYVVGTGQSNGIITPTANALQQIKPSIGQNDGFLLRVNTSAPNLFQIDYATYLGGKLNDFAGAVAFDPASGGVLVAGQSNSADFPTTAGSYLGQPLSLQSDTAFLIKLDLNALGASQLVYGTFLDQGSSGATALAILPGGLPAIAGVAHTPGFFPVINSFYPWHTVSEARPFLSVFSANASSLSISTFLNSATGSQSTAPLLASNGSQYLYLATSTNEGSLATTGAFQQNQSGKFDVLVRKIDMADVLEVTPVGSNVTVPGIDLNGNPQPVTVTFAGVTRAGLTTVTPTPTVPPSGFVVLGGVAYDVVTTALYAPPVLICINGSFVATDAIYHFQNNQWVDVTSTRTSTQICGSVPSLSPFAILRPLALNHPPTASAEPPLTVEATSAAGADVTLNGSGTDPDNDPLSFAWTSATCGNASGQSVMLTCPLGANTVTLTADDGRGGTASDSTIITVRDTTSPVLHLPTSFFVEAIGPTGAPVTYSVSSSDSVSGSAAVACAPASGSSLPLGPTIVNCSATDGSGNTSRGSFTATVRDTTPPAISIMPSTVTVAVNAVPVARGALGLPSPVVSDLVDPHPVVTDTAPASFPAGTTTITFTATDASGNAVRTMLTVNVQLRQTGLTILKAGVLVTSVHLPNCDLLAAELTVQLAPGASINPSTDAFHFALTAGTVVIPVDVALNRFRHLFNGALVFAGPVNSFPTDVAVKPLGGGKYVIVLGVAKTNLAEFKNPATIEIGLGSNTGTITTNALIIKK